MSVSPITGKTDLVTYKILSGGTELGGEFQVLEIDVNKSINKISTARIVLTMEFEAGDNKTFAFSEDKKLAPGEEFEIQLGYHSKDKIVFKGIIVNMEIRAYASMNQLILNCSHKAVKMTLAKKNTYFKEKSDSTILSIIIKDYGLIAKVDTTDYTYQQMIQYYSTDWNYIQMRAEANGLLLYTEEEEVFIKKPAVSSSPVLEVTYGKDVINIQAKVDARFQMPSIKTQAWDMKKQAIEAGASKEPKVNMHGNLTGKKLSDILKVKEFELQSGGPLEKEDLNNWANGYLLKSRLSRIQGEVETVGTSLAKLNTTLKIIGFGARINGEALITSVDHHVAEGIWSTTIGFGLSPDYFGNRPEAHSPPASGLLPAVFGLQNGKVKKIEQDPDSETRVLVEVPLIAETGDGIWARLSKFYATKGKGSFFMPEIGDEVILGFINNDPRFPVILGSLYSSNIKAPYVPDEDNSIKAIWTKSDLKLEFNDKDKIITLETPGGNKAVFSDKDKSILIQDQHGNKIEMDSSGITIDSPKEINISATSNIKATSKANISVETSAGDISLKSNNINATANMNFVAKGNMNTTLEAGLNATVKSGLNMTIQGLMVMIN